MIEVLAVLENVYEKEDLVLLINGEQINANIDMNRYKPIYSDDRRGMYQVVIEEYIDIKETLQHSFSDISNEIASIDILGPFEDYPLIQSVGIAQTKQDSPYILFIGLEIDIFNWNKSWSIAIYIDEYKRRLRELDETVKPFITDAPVPLTVFGLRIGWSLKNVHIPIRDELNKLLTILYDIDIKTNEFLSSHILTNSLITSFDFPESLKVPCQQYLLYFIQFLKDVGVEATADMHEEAGKVLFSVTPKNDEDALENVRRALDVYLRLPTNPSVASMGGYTVEPAIQQLAANVQFLQGQLLLQSALIQAKDTTIQAQQQMIQQQQEMRSGQVLIQSAQPVLMVKEEKDKEEFLGGAIAIKPYEGEGFDINLPMMYRWARDLFKKRSS